MNKAKTLSISLIALAIGILFVIVLNTNADDGDTKLNKEYVTYINQVCDQKSLSPELVEAIIEHESRGKSQVVSSVGCVGLMQMSPKNQFSKGRNLYDWKQNIDAGTDFLVYLFEEYGDIGTVLVAYNCGEYSKATKKAYTYGQYTSYANKIMARTQELEKLHYEN